MSPKLAATLLGAVFSSMLKHAAYCSVSPTLHDDVAHDMRSFTSVTATVTIPTLESAGLPESVTMTSKDYIR